MRVVVVISLYSFVAQKCRVHSVLNGLFFRIDFEEASDGVWGSVLLLSHLCHFLCSAGTRHIKLPCFRGDTSCCFCTPWPSTALEEKKAFPGAAQLAWRCGMLCCKAVVSKYHLLGTKQRSVEWFGAAKMGMKFLIYLPQAEWLQLQGATPLADFYPIQQWQVKVKPSSLLSVVLLHKVLKNSLS